MLLARLSQLNPTTVFLATAALVLAGLLAPRPFGGILLLALAATLAAVLSVTWSLRPPHIRASRVAILALLVILGVSRLI
ncbi:hypothetical protein HC028_22000 [Planosporangium flavigriseum]|nr:hypothetical protein [Planosporangium flavigriseum]